jgi:hypothetical protein
LPSATARRASRFVARAADARQHARFDHPQQIHLRRQRHLGDLVEKQRAAFGLLEKTRVCVQRAGERAALVSEKLAT